MKFGIAFDEALAVAAALSLPSIELAGLDMHVGSQISQLAPYEAGLNRLLHLRAEIERSGKTKLGYLDMGGGLAVSYESNDAIDVAAFGKAVNDLLGGQVQMMFDSVPTMAQMIQAGRVKALGTTGKVRSPILPDVPTLSEAGVPGYEASMWIGFMAPTGTPQMIVERLNREINTILLRPELKAAWEKQGAEPMVMTPDAFGAHISSEIEKWANIITANAIKGE
jgi:hypothetical protein